MPSTNATADRGCPKCGHTETTVDKIATSGGGLSKVFDVQNRGFRTVTCTDCGYTELYKSDSGTSDLVDVFLG